MIRRYILPILLIISMQTFAKSTDSTTFKPSGSPIIHVFGTVLYDTDNNGYDFYSGRAHLGYQYQFSPKWSAKAVIDRGRATSVGNITVTDTSGNRLHVINQSKEGAYYTMYLKFATLQYRVNDKLTLQAGLILQNHYITQERFWGLRYVAQTFQDMHWKIPSTDLGFIAYYKINSSISFDAAITNGEGSRIKQDDSGNLKFAGGVNINPLSNIHTRIYYHNKQSVLAQNEQMISLFAGYKPGKRFRIGCEYNYVDNLNNSNLKSYGLSIFTAYKTGKRTELFARNDKLQTRKSGEHVPEINGEGSVIIGGISYTPVKGINVSINYQGWISDNKSADSESNILLSMEYKF